ncbi:hypothetical protein NUW54_g8066 [Trametes sanguinea]|uniref:Uncharacterized protein n=1 Tax=Trametes sanguinea TaxID=158606 RepID=A0ACC1PII6_9APHY|nr:hypothetical protein NUW54_g8066 [Trametes sanguinea]
MSTSSPSTPPHLDSQAAHNEKEAGPQDRRLDKTHSRASGSAHRSFAKDVILICTVTLAMILNIGNSAAVVIALPTMGKDLNIVQEKLQWIISAYSLSSGCLLLFLGRIADLYSRKYTFIIGCAFMGAFGLGCGFAQDEITLFVLRGIQGIGAAACIPAALGILALRDDDARRARGGGDEPDDLREHALDIVEALVEPRRLAQRRRDLALRERELAPQRRPDERADLRRGQLGL